jgi:hypothetical protein
MSVSAFGNFGTGSIAREALRDVLALGRDLYHYKGKNVPKGKLVDRIMKAPRRSKRAFKPKTRAAKMASRKRKRTSTKKRKCSFKKARKPRVLKDMVRRKYDDHSTLNKSEAAWLGVQHHTSYTRIYDIVGEAVLKTLLNKAKIFPRHYDDLISDEVHQVIMYFKRMNTGTGVDEFETSTAGNTYTTAPTTTYALMATTVSDLIQLRATGGSPGGGGYYLYAMTLRRGGVNLIDTKMENLDSAKLIVKVQRTVSIQNITPSDDAVAGKAGESTDLNCNPLVGKRYKFSQPIPKIVDQMKSTIVHADIFQNYTPSVSGLSSMPDLGADDYLAHPVNATGLFTNCRGVASISLAPGKMKKEKVTFSYTGSLRDFVLKNPVDGSGVLYNYTVTPSGSCTWFCFEQEFRHGTHSKVGLGVNVDTEMQANLYPKMEKRLLKHYDQSAVTL